jgi:hypothetical protein
VDSSHVFGMYLEFFIFGYLRILLGFGELIFNSSWRLQIHYDRFGKDGLFSHREVSVLFVPDLSECLPSLDAWRDQWLAHKRSVVILFGTLVSSVSLLLRFLVQKKNLVQTKVETEIQNMCM